MYVMYDGKTQKYSYPMTYQNDGEARRELGAIFAEDPKFRRIAADVTVISIGGYDDKNGKIESTEIQPLDSGKTLATEYQKGM